MRVKPFIPGGLTPPNGTWSAPVGGLGAVGGAGAAAAPPASSMGSGIGGNASARRAARDLGAGGELGGARLRARERAHQARRDEQHDLGLGGGVARAGEQAPEIRQVAQARHPVCALAILVADQPGEDLGLAVAQPQRGGGVARADLVGERAAADGADLARDVAHLERDLDADLVVQVDERLDLELEPDVEVAHRLGDEAAGGGGGGGDHRHAVADVDPRLLLVLHADARVGEHAGGAVLLAQLEQEQRVGERELHQLRAAVLPFGQADGARARRRRRPG